MGSVLNFRYIHQIFEFTWFLKIKCLSKHGTIGNRKVTLQGFHVFLVFQDQWSVVQKYNWPTTLREWQIAKSWCSTNDLRGVGWCLWATLSVNRCARNSWSGTVIVGYRRWRSFARGQRACILFNDPKHFDWPAGGVDFGKPWTHGMIAPFFASWSILNEILDIYFSQLKHL